MRSELSRHNKDLEYLLCTSRNIIPALVWAVAAHRAQGSRLRSRLFPRECHAGGHCRRPRMAQEGVLGRVSGRSWVSRACWERPHPALGHPIPSAGVLPACRGGPRGVLSVMGSWEDAAALGGISAVLDCGWGADCKSASVFVAASRRYCNPAWRPRPRAQCP